MIRDHPGFTNHGSMVDRPVFLDCCQDRHFYISFFHINIPQSQQVVGGAEKKGEDIVGRGQKVLRHTFVKKSNRQPGTSTASLPKRKLRCHCDQYDHCVIVIIVTIETSAICVVSSDRSS